LVYLRVDDNRPSSFKPTLSPSSLCYSLTHAHRSIGHRKMPQPLADSAARLIYLRVYDSRASSSKPTLSPSSLCYSLTHSHRSIGYRSIPQPVADSAARLIYLRVDDNRAISSKPTPSPLSLYYSLKLAHSIYTPTHPTPTLLTFTCTQVLWFLVCLTRSRASGVTTRSATRLTIVSTRATQCIQEVFTPPFL